MKIRYKHKTRLKKDKSKPKPKPKSKSSALKREKTKPKLKPKPKRKTKTSGLKRGKTKTKTSGLKRGKTKTKTSGLKRGKTKTKTISRNFFGGDKIICSNDDFDNSTDHEDTSWVTVETYEGEKKTFCSKCVIKDPNPEICKNNDDYDYDSFHNIAYCKQIRDYEPDPDKVKQCECKQYYYSRETAEQQQLGAKVNACPNCGKRRKTCEKCKQHYYSRETAEQQQLRANVCPKCFEDIFVA